MSGTNEAETEDLTNKKEKNTSGPEIVFNSPFIQGSRGLVVRRHERPRAPRPHPLLRADLQGRQRLRPAQVRRGRRQGGGQQQELQRILRYHGAEVMDGKRRRI